MPTSREDLPATLKRSPKKAQDTYAKTLDSAHKTYGGNEERAHRAAIAAVKHSFEKVGDHWEPKQKKGPSDPRAARGGPRPGAKSAGGVDVNGHTREELLERARKLGITGVSRMRKVDLGRAIAQRERSKSRSKSGSRGSGSRGSGSRSSRSRTRS